MSDQKLSKTLLGNANHTVELLAQRDGEDMMALPEPFAKYEVWREESFADLLTESIIYRVMYNDQSYVMIEKSAEEWE